jgi:hypothetical protein
MQIEIDFDVFKELTNRRDHEGVSYNDVLRRILQLPVPLFQMKEVTGDRPWRISGTTFPVGSEFAADYKGTSYTGAVKDGKLVLSDGFRSDTPSAAAVHVTGSATNGWRFWKCRLPGSSQFVPIERLRGKGVLGLPTS